MTTKETEPAEIESTEIESTETESAETDLPTVDVSWSETGCLLEFTGRMNQRLLDHARDLVYAQTKPNTRLVVRFRRTVVTGELLAMLIAARRFLSGHGSSLEIQDPDLGLPDLARVSLAAGNGTRHP